jgi:hypothetical protein
MAAVVTPRLLSNVFLRPHAGQRQWTFLAVVLEAVAVARNTSPVGPFAAEGSGVVRRRSGAIHIAASGLRTLPGRIDRLLVLPHSFR